VDVLPPQGRLPREQWDGEAENFGCSSKGRQFSPLARASPPIGLLQCRTLVTVAPKKPLKGQSTPFLHLRSFAFICG
jgi:hypothetical protein